MKFPYKKFLLPTTDPFFGSALLKPMLPIELVHAGRSVRYQALVDSGADFCIFHAELGDYLGLAVHAGVPVHFGGIQERGGATAYLHAVGLVVGGDSHAVTVGFSDNIANQGFGVLGQKGFFDLFVVKFDLAKEEIELTSRAERQEARRRVPSIS